MKNKLTRAALLIALPILSLQFVSGKSHQDIVENAKKFTVLVTNEGLLGGGRGTGILLDETHVLTCMHMADSPKDQLFVYTYPFGGVIKAHPEYADRDDDLLVLVLESSATVHVKPVFQSKYQDGEAITIIGNALGGMGWYVTSGVLSGQERGNLLTDARVNHGNSGGPWINSRGEIVALTDWIIVPKEGPGISGGISAKAMLGFLKAIDNQKKMMAALMKMLGEGK